tara:strand:+ start:201 stop:443 length:243 start_codon:yes stop_codon:yes gene_type:complete
MTNPLGKELIEALEAKYKGQIAEAAANIRVYIENPTGIGEHPDVVAAMDSQVAVIAEAQEKLDILLSRKFNFSGTRHPVE